MTRMGTRSNIAGAPSVVTVTVTPWSCMTDDDAMTDRSTNGASPLPSLDTLRTWREASTSGTAIASALATARSAEREMAELFAHADRVILTGAGSSYYLAQVTAAVAREMTGRIVLAAPLSELILRPTGVLGTGLTGRQ